MHKSTLKPANQLSLAPRITSYVKISVVCFHLHHVHLLLGTAKLVKSAVLIQLVAHHMINVVIPSKSTLMVNLLMKTVLLSLIRRNTSGNHLPLTQSPAQSPRH